MPKIGVVLSGCGVYDGSEIHEAVSGLLALSQAGATYQCLAPDAPQLHVINHLTGEASAEMRNVLVESARIARGDVLDLAEVKVADYDGFFFPGGFGAAKNLSTFAVAGAQCDVNPAVARIVREAHAARIPLCFVCIAPVLPAKILGAQFHPQVTIGTDAETGGAIEAMGGQHVECPVREAVVDRDNLIVTGPAYMTGNSIAEVYEGIRTAVVELLNLVQARTSARPEHIAEPADATLSL
jgi:enhancing lycopene biosynthesis protein 2